jgi:hypothetical protein
MGTSLSLAWLYTIGSVAIVAVTVFAWKDAPSKIFPLLFLACWPLFFGLAAAMWIEVIHRLWS